MNYLYLVIPFFTVALFLAGMVICLRSKHEHLSISQMKRLSRLYSFSEITSRTRASPLLSYQNWVKNKLARIGYADRVDAFYSFVRITFIFFLASSTGVLLLSGFAFLDCLDYGMISAILSLLIPNVTLWFMVRRQHGILATELAIVSGYTFDALSGSDKDLYKALDESMTMINLLFKPMEHFINNYRNATIEEASAEFLEEVPIPEAEEFIFLISQGLEYQDHVSLLEYLQTASQREHNLYLKSRERRLKNRDSLFNLIAMIPAILFMVVLLYTISSRVTGVMDKAIW